MSLSSWTSLPGHDVGSASLTVDHRTASPIIVLDPGRPLASATFGREGGDLVVHWDDGTELVVSGYFDHGAPARLVTPQGEALAGDLVARLAGPLAPAQVVQADSLEPGQAVGQVATVEGDATATRPDGTVVPLTVGTPIGQGDVLATGAGGALAVTFVDGTRFSLGAEARMVVDEFVYDPSGGVNAAAFDVLQGVFVFVSGEVAHTSPDAMTLTTPVATIGIRGTALALRILPVGLQSLISLLTDPDGDLGSVTVTTNVATVVLDDVNEATTLTSLDAPPGSPFVLNPDQLADIFGAMLAALGLDPDFGDEAEEDQGEEDAGDSNGDEGGEGDASGEGESTESTTDSIEVVTGDGLVTTLTPVTGPVVIEGALTLAQLGIVGVATLDSGQTVIAVDGFGDDDDVILLVVDADNVGVGTAGDDSFTGSDGDDAFFGDAGNDHIAGAAGNDSLFGDAGNDFIDGGDDNDVLAGDGLFTGDIGDDVLHGGNGDDVLIGGSSNAFGGTGAGADVLVGGGGDDILQPGPGVDLIDGGTGIDTLDMLDGTQGASVDLSEASVLNDGFGNAENVTGVENIIGTQFDDTFFGDNGANVLAGNEGNDVLAGGTASDGLFGGFGDDILFGGSGTDALRGDDAPDDGGLDVFKYLDPTDGSQVATNVTRGGIVGDVILDFVSGQDMIEVAFLGFGGADLGGLGPLTLGQTFSVIAAAFDGTDAGANGNFADGLATFIFSTADDTLYFDDNGNGAGYSVIATLQNGAALAATDVEVFFSA